MPKPTRLDKLLAVMLVAIAIAAPIFTIMWRT